MNRKRQRVTYGVPRMRFDNPTLRKLQPKSKQYDVRENDGFGVRVVLRAKSPSPTATTGTVSRVRLTLGTWPTLSLSEARKAHTQVRALVLQGIDPREQRESVKRKTRAAVCVSDLASAYLKRWAKPRKRSWREDQRILRKYLLATYGNRPVNSIRRREMVALLNSLTANGMGSGANRVLAVLRRMFNWAIEQDILETSPCFRVKPPAPERSRDRVLSDSEIRLLLKTLSGPERTSVDRAILFQLLTAQRVGEVCGASWTEIDGDWWTIPGARAKNKLAHRVPLTEPALALLAESREQYPDSPWCFPAKNPERPTTTYGVVQAIEKLRNTLPFKGRWTSHDLRRTAAS